VRDLLLDIEPKDYDVATDASPEQIKPLFRRALVIGRRFRLVHVMMGPETIEVSTFRAANGEPAAGRDQARLMDEHGRVLRDNVFGSIEDDARRRDFTINALYYDCGSGELIDYHGGLADLKKRTLRIIGDPETRYREDPVRMLRAVRLGAKLGLSIDAATRAPIKRLAPLLEHVPPPRLFEEMLKLLLSGHANACLRQLRHEGLHRGLLPLLDVILEQPLGERFVTLALAQTDERVLADRPVSPAFLFAALLWHEVLAAWKAREKRGERRVPARAQQRLAAAGIPVRRVLDPQGLPMHDKFLLVEAPGQRWVAFGSFNWSEPSRRFNREIGVMADAPALFDALVGRWETLTARAAGSA